MRPRPAILGGRASPGAPTRAVGALRSALGLSRVRGSAAWDAVRGTRVGPPVAVRRWPWALGAAALGALAGGALTVLVRRLAVQDAPGAQEPEELRAVVDRPDAPGASIG